MARLTIEAQLFRRAAAVMLNWNWLHGQRKSWATALSVITFFITGALALPLISVSQPIAGLLCLVGWSVAGIFDCLDGALARANKTATLAGAGVDASADILSMSTVTAVVLASALNAGCSDAQVGLLVVGQLLRTAGPVWTLSDRLAAADAQSAKAYAAPTGRARAATTFFVGLATISDYSLWLILLAGGVLVARADVWGVLAAAQLAVNFVVATVSFAAALRNDHFL